MYIPRRILQERSDPRDATAPPAPDPTPDPTLDSTSGNTSLYSRNRRVPTRTSLAVEGGGDRYLSVSLDSISWQHRLADVSVYGL